MAVNPFNAPPMRRFLLSLSLLFAVVSAQAAMTIEIIGGAAKKIPVAVLPFSMAQPGWLNPAFVIASDLAGSGYFRLLDTRDASPLTDPRNVPLPAWKGKGADAVVLGQVQPAAEGKVEVRFWLLDAVKQTSLLALAYTTTPAGLRVAAHKAADAIHEKLLGEPGAYSGRIAYILKRAGRFELQVADADSQNAVTVVSSPEPIISPAWSPDGARLAYVSFEDRKPVVFVQSLTDGTRKAVARFKGSNSAPAWSPDGKRLAIALSKDETSQLYLLDVASGGATRITRGGALDTEPVFSPDGQTLFFTSDRGGSPQIYRVPLAGGEARRVTFEGDYNVSPDLSPDGKTLAYVTRREGRFLVAAMDFASGQSQVLSDTVHDESPSFAPGGRMILYATLVGGRGVLATVSVDGRVKQRLTQSGDLREPAWGR